MPKEITYTDQPAYILMPDGSEIPESQSFELSKSGEGKWRRRGVHVGWTKGRFVEIGAASFDPSRELPNDGLFMSLDREGINRLIRSLRRARDAAFGSDA